MTYGNEKFTKPEPELELANLSRNWWFSASQRRVQGRCWEGSNSRSVGRPTVGWLTGIVRRSAVFCQTSQDLAGV